jgi:hypothetical protein
MKADVHPGRLDPDVEVRKRSPYLLDAGFFEGRYYLYYGVVPAVLLLLPYSSLTGHDLSLAIATLAFVAIGFVVSVLWYRDLRRRFFPEVGPAVDHAAILLLAFGPATAFLVRRAMFYELPLAAGYAFLAAFIFAISRALDPARSRMLWMAAASACVGFAAGCHPNYALLCPLVALSAWWVRSDREKAAPQARRARLGLALAAIVPAAALGSMLALYNYARFGDPLEFGFKYGVNVFFETGDRLLGLDFIWPNLKWYYFTPPTLLPYFPFVFPADATFRPPGYHGAEAIHGQCLVIVALVWIGLGLTLRRAEFPSSIRRLIWMLVPAYLVSAGFIFLFGIRANRYLVDFQLPLIALALLCAMQVDARSIRGRLHQIWRYGVITLVTLASTYNVLAAVQQFDDFRNTRPQAFERLSKILNPSWAFWEKFGLVKTGTLVMDVSFPVQTKAVGEPLITVGIPGYSDSVYAIQHPGNLVEFSIDHLGYGGPKSRFFNYEPGKSYQVEIELGSFYPPRTDPYFAGSPSRVVERVKTNAKIVFDGQTAIDQSMAFHEAAPWQRALGSNWISHTLFSPTFSGQIRNPKWVLPSPLPEEATVTLRTSAMRMALEFPLHDPVESQPLVGFGINGAGNLLYLKPQSPGKWLMFLDEWGHASQPPIPVEIPPGFHTIDLFIGPLAASDPHISVEELQGSLAAKQTLLIVWHDGQLLGSFSLSHHLDAYKSSVPGANIQGFSTTTTYFYGQSKQVTLTESDIAEIRQRAKAVP